MTTLSYKTMAFGPEILGICQHLNLYAPIFLLELVETRGADDYWEAKVSLLGSADKPEREITETFEVHAEAKEQCLRIAAHKALGRLVCRYSARLEGTVYKEMTKISSSGNIWPREFRPTPGMLWPETLTYHVQSLERHILNLERSAQSDLYTIIEHQQTTRQLKRANWKLQQENREMQREIQQLKAKLEANGVEDEEEEPEEVDTAEEEEEPKPKRRNTMSAREYRMLFSPNSINNFNAED
jgi:hypothetical protein